MVRTHGGHLGGAEKPLAIISGVNATLDILTGRRTVLDYLLKAFYRVQEQAPRGR